MPFIPLLPFPRLTRSYQRPQGGTRKKAKQLHKEKSSGRRVFDMKPNDVGDG